MQEKTSPEYPVELDGVAPAKFMCQVPLGAGSHGAVEEGHESHDTGDDAVKAVVHHPQRGQNKADRKQAKNGGKRHLYVKRHRIK